MACKSESTVNSHPLSTACAVIVLVCLQFLMFMSIVIPAVYWWKRHKWAPIKNMKIEYRSPKPVAREQASSSTLRFRKSIPK